MPSPSARLSGLIARRHGVVTKPELIGDGYTENTIRRQVTTGTLVRVHRGVYRIATSADTFESRCAAACLADPSVAVTSISAGKLWRSGQSPATTSRSWSPGTTSTASPAVSSSGAAPHCPPTTWSNARTASGS